MPILHPDSLFVKNWKVLVFLVTLYNVITIPFRITFQSGAFSTWLLLDLAADLVLVIDIFLRFHIGFYRQAEYIDDTHTIALEYRRSKLKKHLFASLPVDLLVRIFVPDVPHYIVGLLRLPRLWRFGGSLGVFRRWESNVNINPTVIRMCKLVIVLLLFEHWVACFWFWIGDLEYLHHGGTWVSANNLHEAPVATQYLQSLYWGVTTLTTVGYGDITPVTNLEIAFTLAVMIVGLAMYAFIIANVTSLIANIDASQSQFIENVDKIQTYMRERNVPLPIQERVRAYYEHIWTYDRDIIIDHHLIDELPRSLKAAISLHLHRDVIEQVPFLSDADPDLIEDLVVTLKPLILPPDDVIIREGQFGNAMYFLQKGAVKVFSEKTGTIYDTMGDGAFFGEIALLFSCRRTASVKALSYCEVFVLYKEDFDRSLMDYPEFAEKIKKVAEQRIAEQEVDKQQDT